MALPEWDDSFFINPSGNFIRFVGNFQARMQDLKVFHRMQADFRVGRHSFGRWSSLPNDQLTFIDTDMLVFKDIFECQCALNRNRDALRFTRHVKSREQQRTFTRKRNNRL